MAPDLDGCRIDFRRSTACAHATGRQDAAAVYRSCDVLIKLSTVEGLALPPLEMFHCGGTVVAFDIPGIAAYAEHGRNALLAPTARFKEAAEQLAQLQRDQDLLDGLRAGARETARAWPSEDDAGNQFLQELHAIVESHPSTDPDALRELTRISSALAHTEPGTKGPTAFEKAHPFPPVQRRGSHAGEAARWFASGVEAAKRPLARPPIEDRPKQREASSLACAGPDRGQMS